MTATALRTMYDAVTVANIPADAALVAGYIDGHYVTVPELHKRFPHALIVTITVLGGTAAAHVVDCEAGDCTPASAAAWAKLRHDHGAHPTIYCSASVVPTVIAACLTHGLVLHTHYELWVAHYDGKPALEAGGIAKQFTDEALGRSLDESVVAPHWPGVDPACTACGSSTHATRMHHLHHLHVLAQLHAQHEHAT